MNIAILSKEHPLLLKVSLGITFTILMIASAFVRIPLFFTPVPLTLQTLVLYISLGAIRKGAFFSQGLYFLLGIIGLPVFANGGAGIFYILGPTGGYLLGFLIVAALFPYFLPKSKSFLRNFIFFSLAAVVVYIFGLSWLVLIHNLSLRSALIAGFYPFLIGETLKIFTAAFFLHRFNP